MTKPHHSNDQPTDKDSLEVPTPNETYLPGWISCQIHLNPESGKMHSDGDHRVRQWIESNISNWRSRAEKAEDYIEFWKIEANAYKRQFIKTLNELSASQSAIDMHRDEFERIKAIAHSGFGDEIQGICDRAMMGAERAVTLIAELSASQAEVAQLRAIFPKILDALGNGSGCAPTCSIGFMEEIPREVALVIKGQQAEARRLRAAIREVITNGHKYGTAMTTSLKTVLEEALSPAEKGGNVSSIGHGVPNPNEPRRVMLIHPDYFQEDPPEVTMFPAETDEMGHVKIRWDDGSEDWQEPQFLKEKGGEG